METTFKNESFLRARILNKGLTVLCIFNQITSAAAMIILLLDASLSYYGDNYRVSLFLLLLYAAVSAIVITLADVYQPKVWKKHSISLDLFIFRTLLYIPYGTLTYIDMDMVSISFSSPAEFGLLRVRFVDDDKSHSRTSIRRLMYAS